VEKTLYIDESFLKEEIAKNPLKWLSIIPIMQRHISLIHGKSRDEGKKRGCCPGWGEEIVKTLAQQGTPGGAGPNDPRLP